MKKLFISAAAIGLLASSGAALAEGNTAQLSVQAEITDGCKISFDGPTGQNGTVNFGKIDKNNFGGATRIDEFFVNCGSDSSVRVDLDAGQNSGGDVMQRKMKNGTGDDVMAYQVYVGDGSARKVWGVGTGDGYFVNNTGETPAANKFSVVLPKGSVAPSLANGVYRDTLTAIVYYNNGDAPGDNNSGIKS